MSDLKPVQLMLVDAFAKLPFSGNPAAICWVPATMPEDVFLQRFAGEMNQSETAYVAREGAHFHLRWFTPLAEVDLCGHATLAAAHALMEWGYAKRELLQFKTRSGVLTAQPLHDGAIQLDFPIEKPHAVSMPPELVAGLNTSAKIVYVGKNRLDYLVQLPTPNDVSALRPDMTHLAKLDGRAVIVTAASQRHYDFVSRVFAPKYGIPEDPVTGSAHCCLAPFWSTRLGRSRLLGFQASARGGEVRVEVKGERVLLAGFAKTVVHGEIVPHVWAGHPSRV
jgi:predicted PhzF superfamily epimerase YddE/YHI9